MRFLLGMLDRGGIVGEVLAHFWRRKLWWIIPIVVVLFVVSAFLLLVQVTGIAPFIYTLF